MPARDLRSVSVGSLTLAGALAAAFALVAPREPLRVPLATSAARALIAAPVRTALVARAASETAREPCVRVIARSGAPHAQQLAGATVAANPSGRFAAVADSDNDAVVLVALAEGGAMRIERTVRVGSAPAQVALSDDGLLYVTERGANTVSVYDAIDGRALCSAQVAADPVGLFVAGETVFVTSGITQRLTALDARSLRTIDAVETPREPRGLTVDRQRGNVFVAHLAGEPLSAFAFTAGRLRALALAPVPIEPESTTLVTRFFRHEIWRIDEPLLEKRRPEPAPEPAGENARSVAAQRGARMMRDPRIVARSVPRLFSARTRVGRPLASQAWSTVYDPARDEVHVAFMVSRTGREIPRVERHDAYGGGAVLPGPEPEKVSLEVASLDLATFRWARSALPEGRMRGSRRSPRVRIPSAVAMRRDGSLVVASMGTNALAGLALAAPGARKTSARETVRAPCGVAVLPDGSELVYSQFAHALERTSTAGARVVLPVSAASLSPLVARGRELFHSAGDTRISSGGLSCGGCHPDGRDDGLVWFLSQGPRQTPTLAGRIEAPFNWNGTAREMADNVRQTVRRLGGTGLPDDDVQALVAYLFRGIRAPHVVPARETPEVARGRALFEDEAACSGCHDAARNFTDGRAHELGGLSRDEARRRFDTPSLRFLSHTAPYFHDGRYATLRAMLTDRAHRMGHLEELAPADLDALEAYLRSL